MDYGLQLAVSGILTGLYRTDAMANNLANASTPGFKPELVFTRARPVAAVEDGLDHLPSNRLLEALGGGAHLETNRTAFRQGPIEQTGNPLDLAIFGDGFFVLRDVSDGSDDAIRLTRDGRFSRDSRNRLVSASSGLPVLGAGNLPIVLNGPSPVSIDEDGRVRQEGRVIGQLEVVDVPDRSELTRTEGTLFIPSASAYESRFRASGAVRQGEIEQSSAGTVSAMLEFQRAVGSAGGSVRMARHFDELMSTAINRFARIN